MKFLKKVRQSRNKKQMNGCHVETQWEETVTSMQAGFLWEDFWNHGSDGYATVLVQLHFISI